MRNMCTKLVGHNKEMKKAGAMARKACCHGLRDNTVTTPHAHRNGHRHKHTDTDAQAHRRVDTDTDTNTDTLTPND